MLKHIIQNDEYTIHFNLSWFLAVAAAGTQILLTGIYTRTVWKYEAKERREQQEQQVRSNERPSLPDRRHRSVAAAPPLPFRNEDRINRQISSHRESQIQLASIHVKDASPNVDEQLVSEGFPSSPTNDEHTRRRAQEDQEFAAILASRSQ